MADINTIWDSSGVMGDWAVAGADLASGDDLVTAVIISLFTDRISHDDDILLDGNPKGWVGDQGQEYPIGSRLWQLKRAKLTISTGLRARDMAREALQWLIDDGVVVKFDIVTAVVLPSRLDMKVTAYRQNGQTLAMNFQQTWQEV